LWDVKRTHASPADRILLNIKLATEPRSCWAIHDLLQTVVMNISEGRVKKTWPDGSVRIDDSGNPWCIAARSYGLCLAQVDTELLDDTPQLGGRLHDETRIQIGPAFVNEVLNLFFQGVDLLGVEDDGIGIALVPALRMIESFRSSIDGQKRNGIQAVLLGGSYGVA
jgi:hypothetical protein